MENIDLLIVEWIQSFRNPFFDAFFLFITEFGDETVFLIIAAMLYWTWDKRFAYRFMMFFLYSAILNGVLKFITARPRPHIASPSTVTLIGEGAGGTSLPSGHAQNSSIMGLILGEKNPFKWKFWSTFLTIMVIFVMLSRLYLGEHYLSDVLFGTVIAYTFYTFINHRLQGKVLPVWMPWLPILVFIPLALVSNNKDIYVALATIVGIQLGVPLEMKWIRFQEKTSPLYSFIRLILGISVALAIRIGLKAVFEMGLYSLEAETNPVLTDHILDFIRYFIIVMWMTLGAPFLFKRFLSSQTAA